MFHRLPTSDPMFFLDHAYTAPEGIYWIYSIIKTAYSTPWANNWRQRRRLNLRVHTPKNRLKVLSNENQGGSKLISIESSCFTV